MMPSDESSGHRYLDINPEGVILKEAQDIAEELMIMKRVYQEQLKVITDFRRHLSHPSAIFQKPSAESDLIQRLLVEMQKINARGEGTDNPNTTTIDPTLHEGSMHEAQVLLHHIQARQAEIVDLEESAKLTCDRVCLNFQ